MTTEDQRNLNHSIDLLAKRLVLNHLQLSFEGSELNAACCEVLNELIDVEPRRVVVVVGAGASATKLPLAKNAAQKLESKLVRDNKSYQQELKHSQLVYKMNSEDFETRLLALSRIAGSELRESLSELYEHRYCPLIIYEILAHMLKHKYIDAIINFNFDELLDQSIYDEFGEGEYYRVISDGDCPEINRMVERFDLPVYIKPHGTASHKSTLRFTHEDYFGLPMDIHKLIETLVSDIPTTLIVIGFGMKSFEFNQILIEQLANDSEIFYINTIPPDNELSTLFCHNEGEVKISKKISLYFIPVKKQNEICQEMHSLDDFFCDLWEKRLFSLTKKIYKPRSINRHVLTSKLFSDRELVVEKMQYDLKGLKDYFFSRAIIELALSIARAKGLVKVDDLVDNRCGKYYSLYRKLESNEKNLLEICEAMGLQEVSYSKEVLRFALEPVKSGKAEILRPDEFNAAADKIIERTTNLLKFKYAKKVKDNIEYFKLTLQELYAHSDVVIRTEPSSIYNHIFNSPEILKTNTAFHYHTQKLLLKEDWDTLLIVTEAGKWVCNMSDEIKANAKHKNFRILLNLGDSIHYEELLKHYKGHLVKESIQFLPWWEHNRHMTILIKDNLPIASLYFVPRLRSSYITPILLNATDSASILEIFLAYWIKAEKNVKVNNKTISSTFPISDSNFEPIDNKFIKDNKSKILIELCRANEEFIAREMYKNDNT